MDTLAALPPLSKYPWMVQLMCPWMDTLTEGGREGVHPWMAQNAGIHGYFDRRWQARCPSMDVPWMAQ